MDIHFKKRIAHISRHRHHFLMNLENVQGVGFGFKMINGHVTKEPCLHVLVNKKMSIKYIASSNNIIPKTYMGIRTDVIEIADIELKGFTKKIRPLQGGYSIGNILDIHAGTLGCIVTRKDLVSKKRTFYILTNNHVVTRAGTRPLGTTFIQPGSIDDGTINDSIGVSADVVPIDYNHPTHETINYMDAGLVKLNSKSLVSSVIASIGFISGVDDASPNTFVKKSGKTTGVTEGKITTIHTSYNVKGIGLFKEQILANLQNGRGDSGSLLLNQDNKATGLFFAGQENWALAAPIKTVLKALNVKILTRTKPN